MEVKTGCENVQIHTGIDVHKNSWELKSVWDHVSLKRSTRVQVKTIVGETPMRNYGKVVTSLA